MDSARVDIKRTHEREAVIAEFRAKETGAAEEAAKSKGVSAQNREINGYPVETLNDPEVLALKNGYQNALSHYLAGFLYEATNEPGLASPGYRQAIELRPDTAVLEVGLRGLDERTSFTHRRKNRMTDVLFIVEAGSAPARKPKGFTLPIPVGNRIRTVSVSYPVIEASREPLLSSLMVEDKEFKLANVVDVNVMARRALKDEIPGMVVRGVVRAIAKGLLQEQLEKNGGIIGSLIGSVASAVTEQADDRMWRTLPGRVYVARGYLAPGDHVITVNGQNVNVTVNGQYALVPIRLYEGSLLIGGVGQFGALPATAPVAPVVQEVPAAASSPAKPAKVIKKTSLQTSDVTVNASAAAALAKAAPHRPSPPLHPPGRPRPRGRPPLPQPFPPTNPQPRNMDRTITMHFKTLATIALCMYGCAQAQEKINLQLPTTSPAIAAKVLLRGDPAGVRVSEMRITRPSDILVVQADLDNGERTDHTVFYRFKWLDGGGNQVGDGETWKQMVVRGLGQQTVKSVAPMGSAMDFRLEMNVSQ
jgi:hypothetical protein